MGTTGIIRVIEYGEPIVGIRRCLDGGIDSLGARLINLVKGVKIVNGWNDDMKMGEYAAGMGDLAAQIVVGLKDGVGGIEIVGDGDSAEWEYEVYEDKGSVGVTVRHVGYEVYDGLARDLVVDELTGKQTE